MSYDAWKASGADNFFDVPDEFEEHYGCAYPDADCSCSVGPWMDPDLKPRGTTVNDVMDSYLAQLESWTDVTWNTAEISPPWADDIPF